MSIFDSLFGSKVLDCIQWRESSLQEEGFKTIP